MESLPCPVSLLVLSFVLEALGEAVPLNLPCSVNMFQPGSQLHRIVRLVTIAFSHTFFPSLNGLICTTAPSSRGERSRAFLL